MKQSKRQQRLQRQREEPSRGAPQWIAENDYRKLLALFGWEQWQIERAVGRAREGKSRIRFLDTATE